MAEGDKGSAFGPNRPEPFAAKRLATLLNNVLANYEAQFGKLELER